MLVEQSGISIDQMRLIYRGHVLKDANSLQSYGEITEHVQDTIKMKQIIFYIFEMVMPDLCRNLLNLSKIHSLKSLFFCSVIPSNIQAAK